MLLSELFALREATEWSGYFKFCVERNPWDKTVSRYFWKYCDRTTRPSFEEFVANDKHMSEFDSYSLNGEIGVDFVGRYEDLPGSIRLVSDTIGCSISNPLSRNANTRKKRTYREMLTSKTHDIIANVYAREIRTLGYSFD